MNGYKLFGTVKEIGVDDSGLAQFYNNYFTYPLFKDDGLVMGYKDMNKRLKDKNLEGNLTGEGMIQGGIIIFDKEGKVRCAYEEEIGTPLDINDLVSALEKIRDE
eukprot:scaffold349941_cov103-Cyclotella_meneghiniana.AAC.1